MFVSCRASKILNIITSRIKISNNKNFFHQQIVTNKYKQLSKNNPIKYCVYAFSTSKLTKEQIQKSTYEELIQKIVKLYNFKQYKIPSTLALLQIHHQYSIFKSGDWVLDIGAGPYWSWTQLALKLTHQASGKHKVVSNDLKQGKITKSNNVMVVGNFLEEPVRTKIAMQFIKRPAEVILIDATPEYSGNQQKDAMYTLNIFVSVLQFSQYYLKKGGTIIFRTIESKLSLQNQNQAKFFFHQVYRYKPSNFRIGSPSYFYILKGFMITDNLNGIQNLLKQYHRCKNNSQKIQVIQKYRKLYEWDPIKIIIKEAQQNIVKMKKQGKKNDEIYKKYQNDPYIKINEILSLLNTISDKNTNNIQKQNAINKLLLHQVDNNTIKLPANQQQFIQMILQKAQEIQKQQDQINKKLSQNVSKKNKYQQNVKPQDKAPLNQNQIFMKSTKISSNNKIFQQHYSQRKYRKQDLYGYNPDNPQQPINNPIRQTQKQRKADERLQIMKLSKSFPQIKQAFEKNKNNLKKILTKQDQELYNQLFEQSQNNLNQDDQISDIKKDQDQIKQQKQINNFQKNMPSNQKIYKWIHSDQDQDQFHGSVQSKLNQLSKLRNNQNQNNKMYGINRRNLSNQMEQRDKEKAQNFAMNNMERKINKKDRPINNKKSRKEGTGYQNYFKNSKRKKE